MAALDLLIKAWDTGHWELGEAFTGLSNEDVWVRPHPRLLSIGEIAMHLGYSENLYFTGGSFDTPLHDSTARYPPVTLSEPPRVLTLGAAELYQEVQRVHENAKTAFLANPHDPDEVHPGRSDWTWGQLIEYMVFHVAYHTGQVYVIRHLMGHETVDN